LNSHSLGNDGPNKPSNHVAQMKKRPQIRFSMLRMRRTMRLNAVAHGKLNPLTSGDFPLEIRTRQQGRFRYELYRDGDPMWIGRSAYKYIS
jgi:hypothetical protein